MRNVGLERYIPYLVAEAQRLERSGADFLVMPCNSLHVFIENIRPAVTIPVMSIVEETVTFLQEKNFHRVGIISTSATIKNKLYENAFRKSGIDLVVPSDFAQEKMGKIIHHLVMGQQRNQDRDDIIDVVSDFVQHHVDCVVLACTDLQLLIPKHPELEVFDTMKIFSDATVERMLSV